MKWQSLFPRQPRDELAQGWNFHIPENMWQWLKEEWLMIGEKTKIFLVFASLVILGLIAALLWTFISASESGPAREGTVELIKPSSPPVSLEEALAGSARLPAMGPSERRILERHFQAIGGVDRIASINSLLATGKVYIPDGRSNSIVLVKKAGQRMRITIKSPGRDVVMAVTPKTGWRAYYANGKLRGVEDLEPSEMRSLKRSAYVVSELYLAMKNEWTVKYLGQMAFNYKMAHVFEVKLSDKGLVRFFIDPETFLDVGREDWYFDSSEELTITRVLGSEHMDIGGLKVPSRIESYEDNVRKQTFIAEDVEINPGILDSTFDRPDMPADSGTAVTP